MILISKYTTTIYEILKSGKFPNYPTNDYEIDEIIESGIPVLFSFDYPWYTNKSDQSYKDFQVMFCNMYLMREIGFETVSLFKQKLKDYLIRFMPYYEKIYYTTTLDYNPLINKDYTINRDRGINREVNGSNDSSSNISNTGTTNRDVNTTDETNSQGSTSENPEVTVNNNNFTSNLQRDRTLSDTSTTEDATYKNNTDSSGNNTYDEVENTTENRIDTISGFEGENKTQAIIAYRQAIVNINLELCEKMKPLFLKIY